MKNKTPAARAHIPDNAELACKGWVTRARITQIMNPLHRSMDHSGVGKLQVDSAYGAGMNGGSSA